jgi:AraC-like DNA-binding protein
MKSSWDKAKIRAGHYEVRIQVETILRTNGFSHASMSDLAKRVGLSPTALSNAIRDSVRLKIDRGASGSGQKTMVSIKSSYL